MKSTSMSFTEEPEDVPLFPLVLLNNNSSGQKEFIPTIGQTENGSIVGGMIFLKALIFASGIEKIIDIIESCRVAFLHHVNGNHFQTLMPSKKYSRKDIYKSLLNISVRLEEI